MSKLCEKTAMDHDKKHWKAAKVKKNSSLPKLLNISIPAGPGDSDANARVWLPHHYGRSWPGNNSLGIHCLPGSQVSGALYPGNNLTFSPSFHKNLIVNPAGPGDQPPLLLPEQWGAARGAVSLRQVAAGEEGGEGPVPLPHRHHAQHQHEGAGRGRQVPDTVLTMLSYMMVSVWRIITSWVTMTASMDCCVERQVRWTNMEIVARLAIYPWSLWKSESNHNMRWKCLLLRVITSRGQTEININNIERGDGSIVILWMFTFQLS